MTTRIRLLPLLAALALAMPAAGSTATSEPAAAVRLTADTPRTTARAISEKM